MSSDPAIVIDAVSKRYRLGPSREQYGSLREALMRTVRAPLSRVRGSRRSAGTDFWALRDVSLEVQEGDIVGLIGRNGAGKTTLLKILSRITDPTAGSALIRGRVGSLLEVGTGFHPELTGRENINLNGAILGMTRAEIRKRFDEIVDFSEIAQFLDTPVKRYSSGMYVRLAFSVAAHFEPEILIVDEVLAVGDAAFQRKCLTKMDAVAGEGRTVLFVSHNMAVIQALCRRGILLEDGRVMADGPVEDAVAQYLRSFDQVVSTDLLARQDRHPRSWGEVKLAQVEIAGGSGGRPATGAPAVFTFRLVGETSRVACSFVVYDHLGLPVATFDSGSPSSEDVFSCGGGELVCEIEELPFVPGDYRVDVVLRRNGHIQDGLDAAAWFHVEEGTVRGRPLPSDDLLGQVFVPQRWRAPADRAQPFGDYQSSADAAVREGRSVF